MSEQKSTVECMLAIARACNRIKNNLAKSKECANAAAAMSSSISKLTERK